MSLLISYYGDDFTGSTDCMEALSLAGVKTVLFVTPPTPEQLARWHGVQAVGVAGMSRAMSPLEMDRALPSVFESMRELGAPIFHYKTCSTFDSAPHIGSIGRAIEIGQKMFCAPFVPLVPGAPPLKRYCLFGNLFATVGAETFRIDRHPTMRTHPITPMDEGDLRLHLARQTDLRIALLDILAFTGDSAALDARLDDILRQNPKIVLFDVLNDTHLQEIGRVLWSRAQPAPLFAAGSSGIEYALAWHWRQAGIIREAASATPQPGAVEQMIVVSGSCSPVTAAQIRWSKENGFVPLELSASALCDPGSEASEITRVVREAGAALSRGESPVIYTAAGPEDGAIGRTRSKALECNVAPTVLAEKIGGGLGTILAVLLNNSRVRRVIVAGGDTSGYVARHLRIHALEMIGPTAPGSPLCRAHASHGLDGLEIVFKGGQVGREDYFEKVRRGEPSPRS